MSQKEISCIDVIRDVSDRHLRQKEAARLLSLTRHHSTIGQYLSSRGFSGTDFNSVWKTK